MPAYGAVSKLLFNHVTLTFDLWITEADVGYFYFHFYYSRRLPSAWVIKMNKNVFSICPKRPKLPNIIQIRQWLMTDEGVFLNHGVVQYLYFINLQREQPSCSDGVDSWYEDLVKFTIRGVDVFRHLVGPRYPITFLKIP